MKRHSSSRLNDSCLAKTTHIYMCATATTRSRPLSGHPQPSSDRYPDFEDTPETSRTSSCGTGITMLRSRNASTIALLISPVAAP